MRNIVILGFMGSGKSFIGSKISNHFNIDFLDTDDLIEKKEKSSISDIFKYHNESYFRKLEQNIYDDLLGTNDKCISLGGGFVVYLKSPIKKLGTCIYLKKSFENIMSSLDESEIAKRPLLKDLKKAKQLHQSRENIYEQNSDIIVDINNIGFDEATQKVLKNIDSYATS